MHPILLHLGPITLYSYGAAMAAAFLIAVGLASHVTQRSLRGLVPLPPAALMDWGCWTMAGGVIGGRVVYVALNWEVYRAQPLEIIALWHGGLVWYGGFLGGWLAQGWYVLAHRYPFWSSTDQVIPFIALGHAIGRIGCFANGCCYGKPTAGWFGVQFPGQAERVVPIQLVESLLLVLLYLVLRSAQRPSVLRRPGTVFGLYLVGYGFIRWTMEWWRGDHAPAWNGWTLYQLMSVAVVVGGVLVIAWAFRSLAHQKRLAG